MSRSPDPTRILEALRSALRNRLAGEGLLIERVDGWLAAWEELAGPPTGADWWEDAHG